MNRALAVLAAALAPFAIGAAHATVNVNTAQQSELQRVKGIDKQKAKAIIDYRNENGPIDSLTELALVPGITPEVISRAESDIAFTGDPFVPKPKAKPAPRKRK